MVIFGTPDGFVRAVLTSTPHAEVMAADLKTFIPSVVIKSIAAIDNTNYLLVGVNDGTSGYVMTLDYTNPGTPTNPGN